MTTTKKINKSILKKMVAESLRKVINETSIWQRDGYSDDVENLNESEEFVPHGYSGDSNYGGYEIQLSDTGEAARVRTNYGEGPGKPSRWLKVYFNQDGVAYINLNGRRKRLDQFMRY